MYVIGEEDGSRYKVGIGHDPEKRVSELQADCAWSFVPILEMARDALGGPSRERGAFDPETPPYSSGMVRARILIRALMRL